MVGGSVHFKCDRTGHYSRDCTATTTTLGSDLIYFHCIYRGNNKAQCPSLAAAGLVSAPSPATLWITDGRQGKADAHVVRRTAFQLTVEEARKARDVVTGSFLVNGISVVVLFDSRATRSFVSLALRMRVAGAPGELDYPLDVEITDDRFVRVARVHQGCTLQLFSKEYSIDLVLIPLCGDKVIMGMDRLSPNRAVIDCNQRLVWIRTPRGES
ncbi:uncharacterized protein LOC111919200 [Lactuca sativa]|uniref:uncharacterized protein LOC111919200 n=1 Tax=Lactuca sativa TaxID=4236 RepID=UPI000CD9EA8E|nr:uncharacterized protein LOC111919200 [Lactuca sativa]